MLLILAVAAAAGWLALWAVLAGRTSPGTAQAQGGVPPRPAGSEPPPWSASSPGAWLPSVTRPPCLTWRRAGCSGLSPARTGG